MNYEIELYNEGFTHLPADEYGLPKLILFTFIFLTIFFIYGMYLLYQHYLEVKKIHLVIYFLVFAYLSQLISMLFELIHLYKYKYDGYGIFTLDLLSEIFEGLSQTIIAFVLICLASGWTLVDAEADESRGNSVATLLRHPKRILKGANIVIFLIIIVVVAIFVLQILNKRMDDNFSKFHDYESKPGKALVGIRFMLALMFITSLHLTIRHQQKRGGEQLIIFLRKLMLLGGLWFLVFPIVVFSAGSLVHYWRHRFVTGSVLILQSLCLTALSYEFLSKHSSYFRLSTLSEIGALPGLFNKPEKYSKD